MALRGKGLVLEEPCVVAVDRRSGDVVEMGHRALELVSGDARRFDLVRPVQGGKVSDAPRAQRMVARMVRPHGGRFFDRLRVLVAVPAATTSMERRVVREVVERAGASTVELIEHTMSAALGGNLPVHEPVGTMVVDVGAELAEAAILSLGSRVVGASAVLGGATVDDAIADGLRREYGMVVSRSTAEELKLAVSGLHGRARDVVLEARGRTTYDDDAVVALIERDEVQPFVEAHWDAVAEVVRECLVQAPPELGQDLISRGVHLCGGGALLGGLPAALSERFQLPFHVIDDPGRAVISGAGKCLEAMDSLRTLFVDHRTA